MIMRISNRKNNTNTNGNSNIIIVGHYGGKNGGAGRASWRTILPRHPLILGRTSSMQCRPKSSRQKMLSGPIWASSRSYLGP